MARKTLLGWVYFGPVSKRLISQCTHVHMIRAYHCESLATDETNTLLRNFWEVKSIEDILSPMPIIKIPESTRVFKEARYEIGKPWKEKEPTRHSLTETSLLEET